jgi:hypothetical protein
MKMLSARVKISGLTLVEMLVVIVVIVLLAALLLPQLVKKPRPYTIACMNNQKQTAIGFVMWSDDNGGKFPWQVSSTNNGTMETSATGDAAPNYSVLLAYVHQPTIFVCPTDPARTVATNQAKILNENVSYFVGLDGTTNNPAYVILTGDRHLKAGEMAVPHGLFVYSNAVTMNWTLELHGNNPSKPTGVMSFDDGHCEVVFGTNTDRVFKNEGLTTSRFAVP